MRCALAKASMAVAAMEGGNLTVVGATGAVLTRNLSAMARLITRSLDEVRSNSDGFPAHPLLSLTSFIDDAKLAADLMP